MDPCWSIYRKSCGLVEQATKVNTRTVTAIPTRSTTAIPTRSTEARAPALKISRQIACGPSAKKSSAVSRDDGVQHDQHEGIGRPKTSIRFPPVVEQLDACRRRLRLPEPRGRAGPPIFPV